MNSIKIFVKYMVLVVAVVSCNKHNDNKPVQRDFSKLTGKTWRSDEYPNPPDRYLEYYTGDSGLLRYKSRTDPTDTTFYKEKFIWHTKNPDSLSMDFGYRISRYRIKELTDSKLVLGTDSTGFVYTKL